jgi:hypothetical protein
MIINRETGFGGKLQGSLSIYNHSNKQTNEDVREK